MIYAFEANFSLQMQNDMRNVGFMCVFMCVFHQFLCAQEPEDFDPYEAERLADYVEHPLLINKAGRSELEESGLMTTYQIASLLDYRQRHGDIMSLLELASVDGFSSSYLNSIASFISLKGATLNDTGSAGKSDHDMVLRSGWKMSSGEPDYSYGMKYRIETRRWNAALAANRGAGAERVLPGTFSGYLMWSSSSLPIKVIAGNFNLRFGQGLALWNGMNMSGISSPSSLMRNASVLSPSWSFTGGSSLQGAAAQLVLRRLAVTSAMTVSKKGILPAVNLSYDFADVHTSLTHYLKIEGGLVPDMKTSADIATCMRGIDLFAEIAYDWADRTVAALVGSIFPLSDNIRSAVHLRFYPPGYDAGMSGAIRSGNACSNEHALSVAGEYLSPDRNKNLKVSADLAYFPVSKAKDVESAQLKLLATYDHTFNDLFTLRLRISERVRSWGIGYRTDVRSDMVFSAGRFCLTGRFNMLHCTGISLLGYVESGYKADKPSIYFRAGLFKVDNWDDRIYVYERDAPGSFNVPAFYGRGVWLSMTGSYSVSRRLKLYLRSSLTSYPFMEKKKPGKAELKLQLSMSL